MLTLYPRGIIEQQRINAALEQCALACAQYALASQPKPFGPLQTAIREAKGHSASCGEIATVLNAASDQQGAQ